MDFSVLKKWQTRLALGTVTMGALVALLASGDDWPPDVGLTIAAVGAFFAWAISELPSRQPHPHDIDLKKKFDSHFTTRLRTLLKDDNFGDPLASAPMMRLYDFADSWTGSVHEFDDPKVQAAAKQVHTAARALADLVMVNTWVMRGNDAYISVKTDEDIQRGERSPRTLDVTEKMNIGAAKLLTKVEAFDRLTRQRLHAR